MSTEPLLSDLIRSAARRDRDAFAARVDETTLAAAVDAWLKHVGRRRITPDQRSRLVRAVKRGRARETKEIQLTHAALLRAAGLDERRAAAAAIAAGANYTEVAKVFGISPQGAGLRIRPFLEATHPRRSDDGQT